MSSDDAHCQKFKSIMENKEKKKEWKILRWFDSKGPTSTIQNPEKSHLSHSLRLITSTMKLILIITFTKFENRSTINFLHVYFGFKFHINMVNWSNPVISSKESTPWFCLNGVESESYFPTHILLFQLLA